MDEIPMDTDFGSGGVLGLWVRGQRPQVEREPPPSPTISGSSDRTRARLRLPVIGSGLRADREAVAGSNPLWWNG